MDLGKGYRTMTSGWQGAQYLRRYGPELVLKPAISLKKIGGATVERLDGKSRSDAHVSDVLSGS